MPILVYEYGLLPPTTNAKLVDDQMHGAHRYRNLLTEIEHERRASARAAMGAHPDMAPLEAEIATILLERETMRSEVSRLNSQERSRKGTADQRKAIRELGESLRDLRARVKESRARVAADPEVKAKLDAGEVHAHERQLKARKECGVYWGTYLLQEADADRARKERHPPKFRRWTGEGRVSTQLQGGLELDHLWGDDTQVQVDEVNPDAHSQLVRRGDRRRASRTKIRLRVGSQGRAPVWAEWPMIYHRPIPPGSVIKVVTIQKRIRDCRTWRWTAQFVIETPSASVPAAAQGAAALNLGYCLRPNGDVRAAYVVGSDGHEEEILVSKRTSDALRKADSIRSIRDNLMNEMRDRLCAWLKQLAEDHANAVTYTTDKLPAGDAFARAGVYILCAPVQLPAWFWERIEHVHLWKSSARFRSFTFFLCANRFPGDQEVYDILEPWRYRDEHLQRYEANMRGTALRRRREEYRIAAARLRERYHTIVYDDGDLRTLQRSTPSEGDGFDNPVVRWNQRLAAGSVLRGVFLNAFGARRWKSPAKNMTRKCHACGELNEVSTLTDGRMHTCSACKVVWDVDANFCRNLLLEHRVNDVPPETARGDSQPELRQSRWKKLKTPRGIPAEPETARNVATNDPQ